MNESKYASPEAVLASFARAALLAQPDVTKTSDVQAVAQGFVEALNQKFTLKVEEVR